MQDHGFDPQSGSHLLSVFLKYAVRLKYLAQLVIGGVENEMVKNVVQPKRRRRVVVVHGLQGKWLGISMS